MLVVGPFGVLTDRIGRKPCVLVGFLGAFWRRLGHDWFVNSRVCVWIFSDYLVGWWPHVFPLRLVWLSGVFRTLGGGDLVVTSIIYVMVPVILSEEDRRVVPIESVSYYTKNMDPRAMALFWLYCRLGRYRCLSFQRCLNDPSISMSAISYILHFILIGILAVLFWPETLSHQLQEGNSPGNTIETQGIPV